MKTTLTYIEEARVTLLADLNRRQGIIRDYVRSVALGYQTGLYLFGPPGTAKTHTVRTVLEREIRKPFVYQRGHLTPVGLFKLIAEHPDQVIVLDDLVTIFRSDVALQILLSALEHPAPDDPTRTRMVSYRRGDGEDRVAFQGGIICISNRELHDDDLLAAFKSRVQPFSYDPSDAHIGALMLDIAEREELRIPAEEALVVARFVIDELIRLRCRFDLRLLVDKAVANYALWKDDESESDWHDLVTASIEEHLIEVRHPADRRTRARKKADYLTIVREIEAKYDKPQDRRREWEERTGTSVWRYYAWRKK